MEITGLLIACVFLFLYAVASSVEYGASLFLLFPRLLPGQTSVKMLVSPLWETTNTFFVFFIVTVFTVFPLSVGYWSDNLLTVLQYALIFFGIRIVALLMLFYADESRLVWRILFAAGSFGAPLMLSGAAYYLLSGRSDFTPTLLLCALAATTLSVILLASSSFFLYFSGDKNSRLERLSRWSVFAFFISVVICFLGLRDLAEYMFVSTPSAALVAASLLLFIVCAWVSLKFRRFGWAFVMSSASVAVLIFGFALLRMPYLVYPHLTLEAAFVSPVVFQIMLVCGGIGLLFIVPALVLLYRLFVFPAKPTN